MVNEYKGVERRQFLRIDYEKPLHFSMAKPFEDKKSASALTNAFSKNISGCGILFSTKEVPELSSLLLLDIDYQTAQVCQEIEGYAMIMNNKLLGKVVRIEDLEDGIYAVGVAFVTKGEKLSEDIKTLVDKAES